MDQDDLNYKIIYLYFIYLYILYSSNYEINYLPNIIYPFIVSAAIYATSLFSNFTNP